MVRQAGPSVQERKLLEGFSLPPHLPRWSLQLKVHTPQLPQAQKKLGQIFLFPEAANKRKFSKLKRKKKKHYHISLKTSTGNTFKKSWSPLMRIRVVNSSRRTMMVHLLKLYCSLSLGLKWEVLLESLAKWKQLSAADSSCVASSVKKKLTAFRKLEFSAEP